MASSSRYSSRVEYELSPYELQRTAHEVITDDTEIAVAREVLNSDMMCPICLDLLNKTMATKCLHRFCTECIVTALRSGNKKCPTCRLRLISKRCLRADPNFDMLVSLIYPSREEFNAHRIKMMEKEQQRQSQSIMVKSITEGLKEQKKNRSRKNKKMKSSQQTKINSSNTSAPSTSSQVHDNVTKPTMQTNGTKNKKITGRTSTSEISNIIECDGPFNGVSLNDMELVLKPYPKEIRSNNKLKKGLNKTDVRYLKAPPVATVEHVSSYLTLQLNLDQSEELGNGHPKVSIYILQTADQYVLLDNNLTLQNVQQQFWNVKKKRPMEMFYSYN